MPHLFPYPTDYFTGFTEDARGRSTGAEITQQEDWAGLCDSCSQTALCGSKYTRMTYLKVSRPDESKVIPQALWFWSIQSYLQILENIVTGIPLFDSRYNFGYGNFNATMGSWPITSASGQWLTLSYTEGTDRDPRDCYPGTLMLNPDWPLEQPRLIPAGDAGGSLAQWDFVRPLGSVYETLDVISWIEEIDFTNIESGSFRLKLARDVSKADTARDETPVPELNIIAYRRASPRWQEIRDFYLTSEDIPYCTHCITTGLISGISNVLNVNGFSQFCEFRNIEDVGTFSAYCENTECPYYSVMSQKNTASQIASFFDKCMMATDFYFAQQIIGTNEVKIQLRDHTSLFNLWGKFRPTSPTSWREKTWLDGTDHSTYKQLDSEGAVLTTNESAYDFSTYGVLEGYASGEDFVTAALPAGYQGQAISIDDWQDKKDRTNWSVSETDSYREKYLARGPLKGYRQDSFETSGSFNMFHQCRGNYASLSPVFSLLTTDTARTNQHGKIERGTWDGFGTLNPLGDYGIKISLKDPIFGTIGNRASTFATGTVHKAYRPGGDPDIIRVECKLSQKSLGKQVNQEDVVYNLMTGGEVVDLPDYLKPNNHYYNNIFGSDQKARKGHAFKIQSGGREQSFTIQNVYPCSGEAQSFVPSTLNIAGFINVPYNATPSIKTPWKMEALREDGAGNPLTPTPMFLTVLADCEDCGRVEKFHWVRNLTGLNYWECTSCGKQYPVTGDPWADDDEFASLQAGPPPGPYNRLNGFTESECLPYELESNEWAYVRVFNEDEEISEIYLIFSSWIFDVLDENADHKANIYYLEDFPAATEISPLDMWLDMELTADQYAVISDPEFYLQVYSYQGDLITLTQTSDSDLRNWFSTPGLADGRFQFQPFTFGGNYYIRFWSGFAHRIGKIFLPMSPPPGISSSDYYDAYISGMPGLHALHKTYAAKGDILVIKDHGLLSDPTDLEDLTFTVKNDAILFDGTEVNASIKERETTDSFVSIPDADVLVFHSAGEVFIKETALSGYDGKDFCIRLE